jgi:hypothetical protein
MWTDVLSPKGLEFAALPCLYNWLSSALTSINKSDEQATTEAQ